MWDDEGRLSACHLSCQNGLDLLGDNFKWTYISRGVRSGSDFGSLAKLREQRHGSQCVQNLTASDQLERFVITNGLQPANTGR